MSEELQIAQTIIQQLGGIKSLVTMAGAQCPFVCGKEMTWDRNPYVMFAFKAQALKRIEKCIVFYDKGRDLYNMEFWKIPRNRTEWDRAGKDDLSFRVSRFEHIGDENLRDLFISETGLDLTIPIVRLPNGVLLSG